MGGADFWLVVLAAVAAALPVWVPLVLRFGRQNQWALVPLVSILFIVVDWRGVLQGQGVLRYLGAGVAIMMIAATRARNALDVGRAVRFAALVLGSYGILGTTVGRFVEGTVDGAYPIAVPLLIIACGWTRVNPDPDQIRSALTVVSLVCLIYSVLMFLTLGRHIETLSFGHEKAFISVLGVATAVACRKPVLTSAHLLAVGAAFMAYPAATFVAAAGAAVFTYLLLRRPPTYGVRRVLAVGYSTAVVVGLLNLNKLIGISAGYFRQVGKHDNGDTRLELSALALDHIRAHPLFSTGFTQGITVRAELSGQRLELPAHNDYLSVGLGGGVLAVALLLTVICLVVGLATRGVRAALEIGDIALSGAIRCFAVAFNAGVVMAFANPVMVNPQTNTALWCIASATGSLSACAIARSRDDMLKARRTELNRSRDAKTQRS